MNFAKRTVIATASVVALTSVVVFPAEAAAAPAKPSISSQPRTQHVANGKVATFKVKAKGSALKFQWYSKAPGKSKWSKVSGSAGKKSTLKIKAKAKIDGTSFRVTIKSKNKQITSNTAKLVVHTKPTFKTNPRSKTAATGSAITLKSEARGNGLKYQWQSKTSSKWKNISGATQKNLSVKVRQGKTEYRVKVKNLAGTTYSKTATVKGNSTPKITSQPESAVIALGSSTTLSVSATGPSLRYTWEAYDQTTWKTVSNGNKATLKVSAKDTKQLTKYRVKVSNSSGSVTSEEAIVLGESSAKNAFAPETPVVTGGDYGFWVSRTVTQQVEGTNINATVAIVDFCYFNDDFSGLPWLELDITYVGTDGRYYDHGGAYIDGDIWDTTRIYGGECDTFTATAAVPTHVVYGGSWSIYDSTASYGHEEIFIKGAEKPAGW